MIWNGVYLFPYKALKIRFSTFGSMLQSDIFPSLLTYCKKTTKNGGRIHSKWSFINLWVKTTFLSTLLCSLQVWYHQNRVGLCFTTSQPLSTWTMRAENFPNEMELGCLELTLLSCKKIYPVRFGVTICWWIDLRRVTLSSAGRISCKKITINYWLIWVIWCTVPSVLPTLTTNRKSPLMIKNSSLRASSNFWRKCQAVMRNINNT